MSSKIDIGQSTTADDRLFNYNFTREPANRRRESPENNNSPRNHDWQEPQHPHFSERGAVLNQEDHRHLQGPPYFDNNDSLNFYNHHNGLYHQQQAQHYRDPRSGRDAYKDHGDESSTSSHTHLQPKTNGATTAMAYPPRPPLDHGATSYASAPSEPLTASGYNSDAAASSPDLTTPGGTHGKLRRPSSMNWAKKDAEQGYVELEGRKPVGVGARPPNSRHMSSYSFSGINGSEANLDETVSKTFLGKLYTYLVTGSIVTRWLLFILPVLGLLWIPGILGLTVYPNKAIWNVPLLWWSIWFSVLWAGWWAALAFSRIIPGIIRATVGVVAVSTRRYIDWMQALHRYVALFGWTLAIWVSYQPLIDNHQSDQASPRSRNAVDIIAKILFAFFLCSAVLLFEKFSIQWIAGKFHERSYAERIADQKRAVATLVNLYKHSIDIPGRSDTLGPTNMRSNINPKRLFQKLRQGVRVATTTTATVFGNVASEIAGSSVLQPNSPQAIIKTVLESANKSRLLARRLFYSFAKNGSDYLLVEDIERYFPSHEEALAAFILFDKDMNGDVSREELEMACLEFHREQLSIENSMRDLDSAVGRLDNIFMSLYVIIAALILAVALDAQFATLITGAGTLVLGLSWLIGGSLQEVLTSIIFLFIKHPFDVGDRVVISKETYTVKEIRLLSTVFLDSSSALVQAPNNQLNSLFIQNIRRSPQMSETFTFDVSYTTSFEDLERLRDKMLAFVKEERRDYQPIFDVTVKDFPEQTKMTLSADIKYKSNGQQGALKAKRRNKWICALKTILAEVKIYGPAGDPGAPAGVSRYTAVPWDLIDAKDQEAAQKAALHLDEQRPPTEGWKLGDKNAAILDSADDVFGDSSELHLTNPRRNLSQGNLMEVQNQRTGAAQPMPIPMHMQAGTRPTAAEAFEMRQRP